MKNKKRIVISFGKVYFYAVEVIIKLSWERIFMIIDFFITMIS